MTFTAIEQCRSLCSNCNKCSRPIDSAHARPPSQYVCAAQLAPRRKVSSSCKLLTFGCVTLAQPLRFIYIDCVQNPVHFSVQKLVWVNRNHVPLSGLAAATHKGRNIDVCKSDF